jgi:hypothetical protein
VVLSGFNNQDISVGPGVLEYLSLNHEEEGWHVTGTQFENIVSVGNRR